MEGRRVRGTAERKLGASQDFAALALHRDFDNNLFLFYRLLSLHMYSLVTVIHIGRRLSNITVASPEQNQFSNILKKK